MKPGDGAWTYRGSYVEVQVSDMEEAPGLDGPTRLGSQDMKEWTPGELSSQVYAEALELIRKYNHRDSAFGVA